MARRALPWLPSFFRAVALQPDGKVVGAGQVSSATVNDLGIVRYHPDLTLDEGFGVLAVDFFGSSDAASDVAFAPDGRIVVAAPWNGAAYGLGLVRASP